MPVARNVICEDNDIGWWKVVENNNIGWWKVVENSIVFEEKNMAVKKLEIV